MEKTRVVVVGYDVRNLGYLDGFQLEVYLAFVGKLCGVNVICLEVVDQGDLLVAGPGCQY